ncbi:hypothetical protein OF83DRAFT_1180115, partial [Amylostereum chailletii]
MQRKGKGLRRSVTVLALRARRYVSLDLPSFSRVATNRQFLQGTSSSRPLRPHSFSGYADSPPLAPSSAHVSPSLPPSLPLSLALPSPPAFPPPPQLLLPDCDLFHTDGLEADIYDVIGWLVSTFGSPAIAIDERHMPKLYSDFLGKLLVKHKRDSVSATRLQMQMQPPPAPMGAG